jgi:hypothetical protein
MLTIRTLAAVLALTAGVAHAEDKKSDKPKSAKPVGTWVRDLGGDNKITFAIKGDTLSVTVNNGGQTLSAEASYGVTKSGTLFGIITEKKGDGGPAEGDLFSFKIAVSGDRMTVTDLKPDSGEAKGLVEGEYKKQK